MKGNEKLKEELVKKVHYFYIGKNYKKTVKKIDENLRYYRIENVGKFAGKEIIYDVQSNMLSNAGLVLSKQYEGDDAYFKVRKISSLPSVFKKASQKFQLGECEGSESPKDFPVQIANAISNSFANVFTIDLVSVVRQTVPKIEIVIKGQKYRIICGTGYEAVLLVENAMYRDVQTNKKVKREGFTLKLPISEKWDRENEEIVKVIEHYCKELVPYQQSRFEIAQRLLYPKPVVEEEKTEDSE